NAPDFAATYERLIAERGQRLDAAEASVRETIAAVRARGIDAVLDLTAKFDGLALKAEQLRVTPEEIKRARAACAPDLIAALERAAERITEFHIRQRPADARWEDTEGLTLGWRWSVVDAAGLYAPGGLAAYPSSVLMNAIPAKAAGVARLAMA